MTQSSGHMPLETRSAMAYWQNGKLYLHCSTQSVAQTVEMAASGVQIVASDLPSFVDLLGAPQDEERRGDAFAVGDHRALARAVLHALEQPNPLQTARAQQAARSYDWSGVGGAVLAVYRAALSAAPSVLPVESDG